MIITGLITLVTSVLFWYVWCYFWFRIHKIMISAYSYYQVFLSRLSYHSVLSDTWRTCSRYSTNQIKSIWSWEQALEARTVSTMIWHQPEFVADEYWQIYWNITRSQSMGDGLVHCNYVCAFKTILECIDLDQLPPRNLVNSVGDILFFRRIVLTHRFNSCRIKDNLLLMNLVLPSVKPHC